MRKIITLSQQEIAVISGASFTDARLQFLKISNMLHLTEQQEGHLNRFLEAIDEWPEEYHALAADNLIPHRHSRGNDAGKIALLLSLGIMVGSILAVIVYHR